MLNYETAGSELSNNAMGTDRSSEDIIINEDWSILVEVLRCQGQMVVGKKIWDNAVLPKEFYAIWYPSGQGPQQATIPDGSYVVFQRVGEFDGRGEYGFELHEENAAKCSWICLAENPIVFVKATSSTSGRVVEYRSGSWSAPAWSKILHMEGTDGQYYYSAPGFVVGKIYPGKRIGDKYLVHLPGYGELSETFSASAGNFSFEIGVDASGHVLSFEANENE